MVLLIGNRLAQLERAARAGRVRGGLVEFPGVNRFVDGGSRDPPRGAERPFRDVPFKRPFAREVFVEVEQRQLVVHFRGAAEVRHLSFRQRRRLSGEARSCEQRRTKHRGAQRGGHGAESIPGPPLCRRSRMRFLNYSIPEHK